MYNKIINLVAHNIFVINALGVCCYKDFYKYLTDFEPFEDFKL